MFLSGSQGPDYRGPPQDQFGDPRDRRMPFDPRDPRNREPQRGITIHIIIYVFVICNINLFAPLQKNFIKG